MFDVIDRHAVTVFGTGAKMISAWEKAGLHPARTHRLESLRSILSTGGLTEIFRKGCPIRLRWRIWSSEEFLRLRNEIPACGSAP